MGMLHPSDARAPMLGRVLVVDDSRVTRMFVERILTPHCIQVRALPGIDEALEMLDASGPIDLLISDVHMASGNGFELLDVVGRLSQPPAVILMTGRQISAEDRKRAESRGAIAFLPKPLTVREILATFERSHRFGTRRTCDRVKAGAPVVLWVEGEDDEPLVASTLHDVSPVGAFIPTEGPLPVGSRVRLRIGPPEDAVSVRGTIIRVQDPSWLKPGGAAVAFDAFEARLGASPRSEGAEESDDASCRES